MQVKVLFAGQDIDQSPFVVNVSKAMGDPTRVQARGPGLLPTNNLANKPTYFDIYTAGQQAVQGEGRVSRLRAMMSCCCSLFCVELMKSVN